MLQTLQHYGSVLFENLKMCVFVLGAFPVQLIFFLQWLHMLIEKVTEDLGFCILDKESYFSGGKLKSMIYH
jgi:hypothetical protein